MHTYMILWYVYALSQILQILFCFVNEIINLEWKGLVDTY